jgi:hypothetical protein
MQRSAIRVKGHRIARFEISQARAQRLNEPRAVGMVPFSWRRKPINCFAKKQASN